LEEVQDDLVSGLYGLLPACGSRSNQTESGLKRSAKNSVQLLKWLLLDWKEMGGGAQQASRDNGENNNLFCKAFLALEAKFYHHMHLDLHCIGVRGDERSGAKEEACQILVLILTQHTTPDGEHQQPLLLEELLSVPKAQQEFELWNARQNSATVQDIIKKNAMARQSELALQQRQDILASKGLATGDDMYVDDDDHDDDHSDHHVDTDDSVSSADDADDVVAAMRKRKKELRKELKAAEGRGEWTRSHSVATRWDDSQLAREQRARAASAARAGQHETIRDSHEAAQEVMEREEDKAKLLSKDPLGISKEDDFDLRNVEKTQAEQMEQALHELQEEVQRAEATGNEKMIKRTAAKKESLESFIDRLGGIEGMEDLGNLRHSILPTNPKFDPILFLTLVHRPSSYSTLVGSMGRLSSK
jgi:hypothetical protein